MLSDFDNQHWNALFDSFKGGPDWLVEKPLAMAAITRWRFNVIKEHSEWQHNVDKMQKAYDKAVKEYNSTRCLDFYFQPKPGRYSFYPCHFCNDMPDPSFSRSLKAPPPPPLPVFPSQPFRPIIKKICANSLGAFSGFGRHTANDFLFLQAIFPGMPSYLICKNSQTFEGFISAIKSYMVSFTSEKFYRRIVSVTNSDNLFAFNEESNNHYMKSYLLVFCRVKVDVNCDLYIRYCKLGYLDPDHIMGMILISYV